MNKQDIYNFLKEKDIWHEITEHKAVFTINGLKDIDLPYIEYVAKNLFVRDDKKRNYYLITVKGDKQVNLKEFKEKHQTRALSFVSENELKTIMNLELGSVTPLGILNDKEKKIKLYIYAMTNYFFMDHTLVDPKVLQESRAILDYTINEYNNISTNDMQDEYESKL